MSYNLESLGDERFQQLCQALLTTVFPNVQCLPVGMPDGGRDAFFDAGRKGSHRELIIFQVKFVKNPHAKEQRDLIEYVVKTEKEKVEKLIEKGATAYYLVTNAQGSSHLEKGSIDKVNSELTRLMNITSYCWWNDDICRRIDANSNVKWSYPDILRGTDVLQILLQDRKNEEEKKHADIIRSYMAQQYRVDAQLKFKQVDLQKDIVDLFVDVPAALSKHEKFKETAHLARMRLAELFSEFNSDDMVFLELFDQNRSRVQPHQAICAVQLLIRRDAARVLPRLVIEGAPGQGKSTLTQFLCQVHRIALLQKSVELNRVETKYRPIEARIPFRIDIRDYASWLVGRDPFNVDPEARLPSDTNPALETFLAAHVSRHSGGHTFSVNDFTSLAARSQILIVLDGFDEVAEVQLRNRLVDEISEASSRIEANALSLQVIVTSRPAAFANSPGFPPNEWSHIEILSLSHQAIEEYARRWMDGRGLDAHEKREISTVLTEKLGQPHIRDLARNPMQLAILLALIATQGLSLPDKRTALYDKYVEIFFNRESEKSKIVRNYRDMLLDIHRFLAWILHIEAETESGNGSITEKRLRDLLRTYLDNLGHPSDLVDELFVGLIERVVAIVSRIQGTFEFEVQPLREYFAARYLYETAPYSPPGQPKAGTRPERFDAIARNFYWLNVTRFYCGCYCAGEQSSIIDGIEAVDESAQFSNISHVRQIAVTLLSDYVFSQQPKLVHRLINFVLQNKGFKLLLASKLKREELGLNMPSNCGGDYLVDISRHALHEQTNEDMIFVFGKILQENLDGDEIVKTWYNRKKYLSEEKWLECGHAMRVFRFLTHKQIYDLIKECGSFVLSYLHDYELNDFMDKYPKLWRDLLDLIVDGQSNYDHSFRSGNSSPNSLLVECFALMMNRAGRKYQRMDYEARVGYLVRRRLVNDEMISSLLDFTKLDKDTCMPSSLVVAMMPLLDVAVGSRKGTVDGWSDFIEESRRHFGERWGLFRLAIMVARFGQRKDEDKDCDLFDETISTCSRVIFAKEKRKDINWWRCQFALLKSDLTKKCFFFAFLSLVPMSGILKLAEEFSQEIDSIEPDDWYDVAQSVSQIRRQKSFIAGQDKIVNLSMKLSNRLVAVLVDGLRDPSDITMYDRYLADYDEDDKAVLGTCIRCMVGRSFNDSSYWTKTLSVISRAYNKGVSYPLHQMELRGRKLPIDIAKRICANASEYPLYLLAAAESVLVAEAGANAIAVGKIAARDGWFD